MDSLYVYKSEYCYQCIDAIGSYNVFYGISIENCSDSKFLINCTGCNNCFGCVGLKNKSFCIFNKQYSQEEYEKLISTYSLGKTSEVEKIKREVFKLLEKSTVKNYHGFNCNNCSGDYLYNCNNTKNTYDAKSCENIKHCATVGQLNNCYDLNFSPIDTEFSYEALASNGNNILFCYDCMDSNYNLTYCDNCYSCKNCFGCSGLKQKSYCILNKQYTKEEYEKLVPQIIEHMQKIGEWGEFFPNKFLPFAYNESVASQYYPLTRDEVLNNGWKWKDEEFQIPQVSKTIPAEKLPDDIKDIPDDILNWAIKCKNTQKPFKITSQELGYYRQYSIPIPLLHPDERHKQRMNLKNPRKLFSRNCDNCNKQIQSTYSNERSEKVYCEECYLKEVY